LRRWLQAFQHVERILAQCAGTGELRQEAGRLFVRKQVLLDFLEQRAAVSQMITPDLVFDFQAKSCAVPAKSASEHGKPGMRN